MKTIFKQALIAYILIPFIGTAQTSNQQIDLRSVPFKEWSSKYETSDNKGKYWNVLYVAEMKTSNGRSTHNDIEINYVTEFPEIMKKAEWFKWSPLDKFWVKVAKPGIETQNGNTRYLLKVNKPGTYALMQPQKNNSKGVSLKAPKGYMFEKVIVYQDSPGISINITNLKPSRSLIIPITDVQFDTRIKISLMNKKGEKFIVTRNLAGNFAEFSNRIKSSAYREMRISSEQVIPFEEDVVFIGN